MNVFMPGNDKSDFPNVFAAIGTGLLGLGGSPPLTQSYPHPFLDPQRMAQATAQQQAMYDYHERFRQAHRQGVNPLCGWYSWLQRFVEQSRQQDRKCVECRDITAVARKQITGAVQAVKDAQSEAREAVTLSLRPERLSERPRMASYRGQGRIRLERAKFPAKQGIFHDSYGDSGTPWLASRKSRNSLPNSEFSGILAIIRGSPTTIYPEIPTRSPQGPF
jgi:hypothetical protein